MPVELFGAQIISGLKNFTQFPYGPKALPDRDYQLANKEYVDNFPNDNTYWDDQQINISAVRLKGSVDPTWTDYKGSQVLAFGAGTEDIIYFTAQLTHKYKEGSNIAFHIHYVTPDANAGNHRWVFTHSWGTINGTFPAESTVPTLLAAPAAADTHTLGAITSSITGTGKEISSLILCSLKRNGGHADDTYASSIYLVALDFHIEMDAIGSLQETSK